ncbi:MAG: tetratricopeptide repeat protein [Deltaproteobacteria bacterium]|nr:tetratricopeptide repeat protein [Deltaproteobacteria bacterium]
MKIYFFKFAPVVFISLLMLPSMGYQAEASSSVNDCIECHATYCQAWQASRHGQTLLEYSPALAAIMLSPQAADIAIGSFRYRFSSNDQDGWIEERSDNSQSNYKITYMLGGKNMLMFLTPLEKGRMQILPLAYNMHEKKWFDNSAGSLPHGMPQTSGKSDWKNRSNLFNTSCFACHISSQTSYYRSAADTYQPLGVERGLACHSCHGPVDDHVRACRAAATGQAPDDLKIISFKNATADQINSICASCHAASIPLTASYTPGKTFFDSFDLKGLESPAFYSDGKSLGNSHVYTQWRMSPCVQSGQLQCLHCHTGGGSYRFKEQSLANNACLPCHKDRVEHAAEHTHHKAKGPGSMCISCHMPTIELRGIVQTDHSMRPPMPSVSQTCKSPNACKHCHNKKDLSWADTSVRKWFKNDYQEPYLKSAMFIHAARNSDWSKLPEMLSFIENPKREEIAAASLIRLLRSCNDTRKWPVFINSLKNDPSPLVRSAAAGSLIGSPMGETASVLFNAMNDTHALVRIRAVSVLAVLSSQSLMPEYRQRFEKAFLEFTGMLSARPDEAQSYFKLGNLYLERREIKRALAMYEHTLMLQPDTTQALINSAMAYYYLGQQHEAEKTLLKALKAEPANAQALVTLGMLLVEQKRTAEAETAFRKALNHDPANAAAYYNLAVMFAEEKPKNALEWCRRAHGIEPDNPKYAYTYAYYLNRSGKPGLAVAVLNKMVDQKVSHPETYALLADIFVTQKKIKEARGVYRKALENKNLPEQTRMGFMDTLQKLE